MKAELHEHGHSNPFAVGDFFAHLAAGTAFILYGCLWTFNTLFRYHVARRQALLRGSDHKKLNYKNALFSIYHSGWARAGPVEAIVVVLVSTLMCIAETISFAMGYPTVLFLHHTLMFSSFGLMGLFEILHHYKFTVPPSSEYVGFILANGITAYLLANHLGHRTIVDTQMHMMLFYLTAIQIACVVAEIMYNRSVTAALGRTLMFIAQGIWVCLLAVVIHPLPFMHTFDLNDHKFLGIISAFPVVAVVIALLNAFIINVIVARRVKNMNLATVNFIVSLTHSRPDSSSIKGEATRMLFTDSDNEV